MQHGVLSVLRALNPSKSTNGTNGKVHDFTADWRCVKRDGTEVPFAVEKVEAAVTKCFQSIDFTGDIPAVAARVVRGVVAAIAQKSAQKCDVEDVQRLVIAQLWIEGLYDAAEHYQNYREAHRKQRLSSPIPAETQTRFDEMQTNFSTDLQIYQFMSKFSRWNDELGRRETWREATSERVIPWLKKTVRQMGHDLTDPEWQELEDAMFSLEASPAMRVVQMAGPALDRCHVGAYNCAYSPIEDLFSFPEMLYVLMQGTGHGFSVESDYVRNLPRIKRQRGAKPEVIKVEDSTEGWCDAYYRALQLWFDGFDVEPDVSGVRKKNARLKTKGGKACLTGDTIVYKDKKKTTEENTLTVAQLYEKRLKTPRRLKHIKLRCLDEATGTFQRNRVVDVIDNGIADVYEVVTENGYRIKSTADHRFMDKNRAYRHLDMFAVGDLIAVNGAVAQAGVCEECGVTTHLRSTRCKACFTADPVCLDCGVSLPYRASRCLDCRENTGRCEDCGVVVGRQATRCRGCADAMGIKADARDNTARARKACQSQNSGVCSLCSRDDLDTQVHHKDGNPRNNVVDNLLTLCEPCHRVLHAIENTFGNPYSHRYLSFDRIVSVTYVGRERVYDICMEAPNHNFVANGFVSHNSGPGPLLDLMNFTRNMIFHCARHTGYLEDTDAHRLACFTGRIVQVGGVRRAATISLSDLTSLNMRGIKSGSWYADQTYWTDGKYLTMANNSAVYDFQDGPPPIETFMDEWLALVKSKSGERGIFNRRAAQLHKPARRQMAKFGCNPCSEIVLRPYGFCNLSIAVARPHDTVETLVKKARLAAFFGMLQCLCTDFKYIRPQWKRNCVEERLLGVDVTAHADCPLLRFGAPGRDALQQRLAKEVDDVATMLSQRWGINKPAANTTIKPAGDSAVFFNAASGLSPHFAKYQIRWVREGKDSPVAKFLIASGVPYAEAPEAPESLLVFAFPKQAPEGATLRDDMTAIDQFVNWLQWKENYAEHSVSTTIYVEEHEWLSLGAKVYENIDKITGVAFLPKDNGIYSFAPNEELTKEEYDEFMSKFPKLNWAKLTHYEETDQTESAQTFACANGSCER